VPATNYTPIQFYRSTTSGNQPSAANLSPGELALNIADTDMTMYFENASGVVKRFFNNPAELKYPTADGTSGQGVKTDGSKTLSFGSLASAAITNNTRQAVTSSATTTIDLASGQVIDLTMAANITTLSFTNVPASGTPVLVQIVVRNASSGTAYTIAWPNSVYWSGQYSATTISTVQTAPTLASGANGVTTIALLTTDGGTKWRGWVEGTIPGGGQFGLYTWGLNSAGRLGLNNATDASSPVQVGSLTNWAVSSSGYRHSVAIKTDGTMWSWGQNTFGALGLNQSANQSSPTQIGALTNWSKVASGTDCNIAIKTDGTLWGWGANQYGQLGNNIAPGTSPAVSSPIQIGALTNWSSIAGSRSNFFSIKTDGTLWAWGQNSSGCLGLNSSVHVSSPTQIGALTTWAVAAGSFNVTAAIKTDGTLWVWGGNSSGQLGQNNTTNFSSPVQVGALTTWSTVSTYVVSMAAIKTDGTLWAWGTNNRGQLGQNNTTNFSSPVQVGALTTWSKVSITGQYFTQSIKTDGTLWSWGNNYNGQLGQNNLTYKSSPVQVGAATTWQSVSCGAKFVSSIAGPLVNPA